MIPGELHFLRPWWFLMLIPLVWLSWQLLRGREQGDAWRDLVDPHLLSRLLVDTGGRLRRLPVVLLGIGWLLLVVALAGPSWQRLPQPVYQAQQYLVVLLDLSPSMNTGDRPPSRLAHARFEVLDMLRRSQDGQVALIAFGAEPYVVSPLTTDVETITLQVPSLATDLLPVEGAQRVDLALREAGLLLEQAAATEGRVILVTDGLDNPGAAVESARGLAQRGYRVSVLGLGTGEAQALRTLATAGDGVYVAARAGDRDLDLLLPVGVGAGLPGGARKDDASADQWQEEGPWLLLVLVPLAALAFRRGWLSPLLVVIALSPPSPGYALSWAGLWQTPDQQGLQKLEAGQAESAAELFERQDWRAAAQYAAGNYAQALATLDGLEHREAAYNRGNALAHLGRLEDALAAYDQALQINPDDADARHNRELIARLLQQPEDQQAPQAEQPDMSASGAGGEPQSAQSQASSEQQGEESAQEGGESKQAGEDSADQGGDAQQTADSDNSEGQPQQEVGQAQGDGQQNASAQRQRSPESAGGGDVEDPSENLANGDLAEDDSERAGTEGDEADEQQASPGSSPESPNTQGEAADDPSPDENTAGGPSGDPGIEDLLGGRSNMQQQWARSPSHQADPESEQAVQQMLRLVEDDPSGLLRQRFLLQHLRRQGRLP